MTVIEVAIGPGGAPGVFRVEVVASPAGEASAAVELDAESLLARRGLLQQAVLASAVPSRRVLPETEQPVREVGEVLFAGLLGAGEVAGRYRAAAAVAAERGEGLRVVLRIDDPVLAGLPWEAMYDQATGAYVCRQDQLVRHVPVASAPAPLRVEPPLRILGVVSSPRGLPALDVDKEQDQLARALARPAGLGLAELHWAPSATWADLQDLLLDGEWHVLHFIGHGDFDPEREEGVLALTREDGRADLVAAHRLVDLLRQARPMPRLVVLNSCSGAAAGASDLFSGTAAALVRGGVSAVAAMQYEISDPAAVAFARGFYAAIARARGVDDAVSSGRVAILGTGNRTLEWVTPVLYLRGRDTRLFTLPAPADQGQVGAPSYERPSRVHPPLDTAPPLSRMIEIGTCPIGRSWDVTLSPDARLLAAIIGETVQVWEPVTGQHLRTLQSHSAAVVFSPDGRLLATGGHRSVQLWDPSTGEHVRALNGHTGIVSAVAFSPDGRLLAASDDDTGAHAEPIEPPGPEGWRVVRREPPPWLRGDHRRPPFPVELWDPRTGDHLRTLEGHTEKVRAAAFSLDGSLLAICDDTTVQLWDPATAQHLRTLEGPTGEVRAAAFSPDGSLLATGDYSTVQLWDPATGQHLRTLQSRSAAVAFSPDGRLLATGDYSTVQLWDPATGDRLFRLEGLTGQVQVVRFRVDGRLLVATSAADAVQLWSWAQPSR